MSTAGPPDSITDEKNAQTGHHEFLGYDDPHRAALEDNPEQAEKLTWSVGLSALFLGTSFTGPIIFGFILVTPILVQLSELIGGESITFWIPSGKYLPGRTLSRVQNNC